MKKIHNSVSKSMGYVRLYKDDLDEIIELLRECGFKDIILTTKTHEYDCSELSKIPSKELDYIDIKSHGPFYFSLGITSRFVDDGARLYISEDTSLAIGIFEKVLKILKRRKRKIFTLFTNLWFVVTFLLVGQIILGILGKETDLNLFHSYLFIWGLYPLAIILKTGYFFDKNKIYLNYKEEMPNFFIRNKDKLLIMIFSAMITAIITYYLSN